MGQNSGIEWTDDTWNPIAGCTIVSPGCQNCYAMRMAARLELMGQKKYAGTTQKVNGNAVWTGKINLDEKALQIPLKKKKPTRYFVNSMSDLFHDSVPDEFIDRVFAVMAMCPQHTFQVLTKRAARMAEYSGQPLRQRIFAQLCRILNGRMLTQTEILWPLPNVWLGVSVENQQYADERIPHLLKTPAAVRFLSIEPLLGSIDLYWHPEASPMFKKKCVDWVIVGGESGLSARPMHPDWARSIRNQCVAAGVPFFFKQWGEMRPVEICAAGSNEVGALGFERVGKKAAGRMRDGCEWNEFPKVAVGGAD